MKIVALCKPVSKKLSAALLCIGACVFTLTLSAGLRGPGKYSGVVIFDRWDTCFLLSGSYITYIADSVKSDLRAYKGKAMQVDASEVYQIQNPGDAIIRKFTIVGPAPDNRRWCVTDGLDLSVLSAFDSHGSPTFKIRIRNEGYNIVEVDSSEIGPTLLGLDRAASLGIRSIAWITRGSLVGVSGWSSTDRDTISATYVVEPQSQVPKRFELGPGQLEEFQITLQVSPGQYQFMAGYGGGVHEEKSIASNAISFEISDHGVATLEQ